LPPVALAIPLSGKAVLRSRSKRTQAKSFGTGDSKQAAASAELDAQDRLPDVALGVEGDNTAATVIFAPACSRYASRCRGPTAASIEDYERDKEKQKSAEQERETSADGSRGVAPPAGRRPKRCAARHLLNTDEINHPLRCRR